MEKKCIYNLGLAGFLMLNHCRLLRVERDLDKSGRDVYLFKNSDKIDKLIETYKNNKEKVYSYIESL